MPSPPADKSDPPWGQGQLAGAIRSAQADRLTGKAERLSFGNIAAALKRQANELVLSAQGAEIAGIKMELSEGALGRAVSELRDDAELLGEAYRIIAGLKNAENSIRAMVDTA